MILASNYLLHNNEVRKNARNLILKYQFIKNAYNSPVSGNSWFENHLFVLKNKEAQQQ